MRVLAKIIVLGLLFSFTTYCQGQSCLNYHDTLSLIGFVTTETFPGPPEYEDVKNGDKPEIVNIFYLDSAVCVKSDLSDSPENKSEQNIKSVQLVLTSSNKKARIERNKRIKITGQMFHAITGHHHTVVLLEVIKTEDAH